MRLNIVIKEYRYHSPGDAGNYHFTPGGNRLPLKGRLPVGTHGKGPHFPPKQHHHCQDRSKLNDHEEHFLEGVRGIQAQKLIHQQHMSGAADGQPFCDALHNAENQNLQIFNQYLASFRWDFCRAEALINPCIMLFL